MDPSGEIIPLLVAAAAVAYAAYNAADIGFVGYDVYAAITDPTPANQAAVGLDALAALAPNVPAVAGVSARAAKAAKAAGRAKRVADLGCSAAKVERMHLLPVAKRFAKHWKRAKLNPEDLKIPLQQGPHRLKAFNGVHTGHGNSWNARWDQFFAKHPHANRQEILNFLARLRGEFDI